MFSTYLVKILPACTIMGRPGSEAGLIPVRYIETLVGGNSLQANLAASVTATFVLLVVIMATISGLVFGNLFH